MHFYSISPSPRSMLVAGLGLALAAGIPFASQAASLPGIFGGELYASQIGTGAGPLNIVQSYISRVLLTCDGTGGKVLKVGQDDVSAGASGKILTADAVVSTDLFDGDRHHGAGDQHIGPGGPARAERTNHRGQYPGSGGVVRNAERNHLEGRRRVREPEDRRQDRARQHSREHDD